MKNSILDLLKNDGLQPVQVTASECASPCPECGGDDRFRCWPETGKWWCRSSRKSGDLPGYLMTFHNMKYPDACEQLQIEPKKTRARADKPAEQKKTWEPKPADPPSTNWQKKTEAFIKWTVSQLWEPENKPAVDYLMGRGLNAETIRKSNLGWNPKAFFLDRKAWDLPEKLKNNRPVKLWLPRGWVLPVYQRDRLSRIKIRRPDGELKPNDQKYIHIPGGEPVSMALGSKPVVVVVEAELDALLIDQEAGGLVASVALGSANIRPDARTTKILKAASHIILALDADKAGARESWRFWADTFPNASRWPVPGGKDATEAYQAGVDLQAWAHGILTEIGKKPMELVRVEDPKQPTGKPGRKDKKITWCSANCPKGERREIEGMPVLWCQVADKPVINLQKCPKNHWLKNSEGRPVDVE